MTQKNISIHGITNETVKGHSIDWKRVEEIFINTDIIAAHNAKFDRSFMDKVFPLSEEKIWACTVNDINWPQLDLTLAVKNYYVFGMVLLRVT